jgi:hypothetical protein
MFNCLGGWVIRSSASKTWSLNIYIYTRLYEMRSNAASMTSAEIPPPIRRTDEQSRVTIRNLACSEYVKATTTVFFHTSHLNLFRFVNHPTYSSDFKTLE